MTNPQNPNKDSSVSSVPPASPKGKIRLGCVHCDRNDFDGMELLPTDWFDVTFIQSWEASIEIIETDDPFRGIATNWETHLGVCPSCNEFYDREETSEKTTVEQEESESNDSSDQEAAATSDVHPIIRQIIDRDCHVGESDREVVQHVASKLRNGFVALREMSKFERRKFIGQCIQHHGRNFKQYVEVMSGFRYTTGKEKAGHDITSLPGPEIVKLMRRYKITIEQLAFRLGTSQKRVRAARDSGLVDPFAIRDWIQAICGVDVGPIPEKFRVHNKQEEGSCCFCGYPLYVGDEAFEYVGKMFCSITCSRKSRGW